MYSLSDRLGDVIDAFDGHDTDCPWLAWAEDHRDDPVAVIAQAPPDLVLIAPLRALADMRHLFDLDAAVWFAGLVEEHSNSRGLARWAQRCAHA